MAKEQDVERQRSKSGKARRVLTTALAVALLLPSVLIPGKIRSKVLVMQI